MTLTYRKCRDRYEKSNLWIDPKTLRSCSYGWYRLSDRINGKIIVNNYSYSRTTARHVDVVMHWFRRRDFGPIFCIEAPKGLQDLSSSAEYYKDKISLYKDKLANPRTRKRAEYQQTLDFLSSRLELVQGLMFETSFNNDLEAMLVG